MPPQPTVLHKDIKPYMPSQCLTATHVYTKKAKKTPLSPISDGPYEIVKRIGKSCLEIKVGEYKNGTDRTEIHHWRNCTPYIAPDNCQDAVKAPLGRKPKDI